MRKKVIELEERIGDGPGSGSEPEVGIGIEVWLKSRVEIGTAVGTGAWTGKAVEIV